jgi:hypothetical protein
MCFNQRPMRLAKTLPHGVAGSVGSAAQILTVGPQPTV